MRDAAKVIVGRSIRWALWLVVFHASVSMTPAQAQSSFKSRRDFRVGDRPTTVLAADYDGDGKLDLITVDEQSGYVSLVKGFGDGTFRRVTTVVGGSDPRGVRFADVNHDGFPDIIMSNRLSTDVTVNLGNGQGVFGTKIRSIDSLPNYALNVGDWNLDGNLDVVVVNSTTNQITTMRGTGTGTFGNIASITVGTQPAWVEVADFNADSISDLAVVDTGSDNVQIWRGNGTGGFTLNTTLSVGAGSGVISATARDLNRDNRPDLVVALRDANSLKVYLANTAGGFNAPTTLSPGLGPQFVAVDDLNADGFVDLIVGQAHVSGVGELAILNGNGAGGFAAPTIVSTGPTPVSIATGDFNGDGNIDVASASQTGSAVSVLPTIGAGTFMVAGRIPFNVGAFPSSLAVADFNHDGFLDVAATDEGSDNISVTRGNGNGTFQAPVYTGTGSATGPHSLTVVDTNHDTWADLVALTDINTMSVLQNGAGAFTATNGIEIGVCDGANWIASGEVNGDTNRDVLFTCEISYHMCTKRGTGGAGGSAFGATVCTYLDPAPEGVTTGFFNFDNLQDVAVASLDSNWLDIGASDGSGGLQDIPGTFPTGLCPRGVVTADLNGDGYDDLVVANSCSATVSALLGDGGGVFTYCDPQGSECPNQTVAGQGPTSVAVADFNLDGKLDIASTNTNSNDISLLLGDGFGYFTKAGDFGTRDYPVSVAAGDFNQDGKPDLVVADHFSDSVTILLNQTVIGDPMQTATVTGQNQTVLRWGLVPGAVYDVIRGNTKFMTLGGGTNSLGAVTCLANDLLDTDTSATPDPAFPPVGEAFFYAVRKVVGGVASPYMVSNTGKPGVPSSGGCF
jgi:FG-GAP-like repeat/FG-GAP repeat